MRADNLQDPRYIFISDSQDLEHLFDNVGVPLEARDQITAAIVSINDGDYTEIWLTESSQYYSIYADYEPLEYYTS